MKSIFLTISALFLFMVLLVGCDMTPPYRQPSIPVSSKWKNDNPPVKEEKTTIDWWKHYSSDELNTMEEWALAKNNDLRAALARIKQARATAKIADATLFPTVNASGDAGRIRSVSPRDGNSTKTSWGAGLDIAYEVDLFGANHAERMVALYGVNASVFDRQALALTVTGEVARNYFNVLSLREQVAIAKENLKITRDVMAIIDARYKAGAVSGLEVAQQKEVVEQAQASLAALVQQEEQAEDALAILEGFTPESLSVTADSLKGLSVPDAVVSLPSTVITHRPDIRAAEERLKAANANIGVARAAFFPKLDLSAGAGLAASPFTSAATRSLSIAASLAAPIFEGGRLEGNLELSKAKKEELIESYGKTVLTALQEVEDALAAQRAARQRVVSLKNAETHARTSYEISLAQYKAGATDFQTLLNAQRDLLNARNTRIGAEFSQFSASVDLFLALGG